MVFDSWEDYSYFIETTNSMELAELEALKASIPFKLPALDATILYEQQIEILSEDEFDNMDGYVLQDLSNGLIRVMPRYVPVNEEDPYSLEYELEQFVEPYLHFKADRYVMNEYLMFAVGDKVYKSFPIHKESWDPFEDNPLFKPPFDATEGFEIVGYDAVFANILREVNIWDQFRILVHDGTLPPNILEQDMNEKKIVGTYIQATNENMRLTVDVDITSFYSEVTVASTVSTWKKNRHGQWTLKRADCDFEINAVITNDEDMFYYDWGDGYNWRFQKNHSITYTSGSPQMYYFMQYAVNAYGNDCEIQVEYQH